MEQNGFFDGPPKTMFAFGLAAGIALSMLFSYVYNGGTISTGTKTAAQPTVAQPTAAQPTAAAPAADVTPATEDDHVLGDLRKAKVVLIEYSDFQCPYCQQHHPTLAALVDKYGDDIAWVYRHFPLTSIHPLAQRAAEASECVAEQRAEAFWEFGDALFAAGTSNLTSASIDAAAQGTGVNMTKYQDCLSSGKYTAKVQQQQNDGIAAGVTGTPATFVNGQLYPGALPQAQLEQVISPLL